jgi:hypothetical protein
MKYTFLHFIKIIFLLFLSRMLNCCKSITIKKKKYSYTSKKTKSTLCKDASTVVL